MGQGRHEAHIHFYAAVFLFFPLWAATESAQTSVTLTMISRKQLNYGRKSITSTITISTTAYRPTVKICSYRYPQLVIYHQESHRAGWERGRGVFLTHLPVFEESRCPPYSDNHLTYFPAALLVCVRVFSCHVLRFRPFAPGVAPHQFILSFWVV